MHGINPVDIKMGLVVQKLIEPEYAGVIYTSVNSDQVLVQYVDGFGSKIVDGETHGSSVLVNSQTAIVAESANFEVRPLNSDDIENIVRTVSQIEELYNGNAQDIEFALVEGELFILQARRLTRNLEHVSLHNSAAEVLEKTKTKLLDLSKQEKRELGTTSAVFSNTNFVELLPNPAEMDIGIFAGIFTGTDGIPGAIQLGRIDMGYQLNADSIGLMHYIGGRPYSSIARDATTYYAGFPATHEEYRTTLVQEYLDIIGNNPEKGIYPEMGLYLQDPTLDDLFQRYGDKAEEYYKKYQEFLERFDFYSKSYKNTFIETELPEIQRFMDEMSQVNVEELTGIELVNYCHKVLEHLRTQSCRSFVKSARLGFYYSQRLQKELAAQLAISQSDNDDIFARLSQGLDGSMITIANLQIAGAATLEEAYELGRTFVGHYSTGEMLQIRHQRLSDDHEALQRYVEGIYNQPDYVKNFQAQKSEREQTHEEILNQVHESQRDELNTIITSAQTYMALRETVKYYFTAEYALLRRALEVLEQKLQLPEGHIYHVYPHELNNLADQTDVYRHILAARQRDFEYYPEIALPNVIRESDIESLALDTGHEEEFTQATGSFLAKGDALEGVIVNLDEFDEPEQITTMLRRLHEDGVNAIVVASQMNLGHDPYIAAASGLIIEHAGIVSHGAQRARELGRGAIGGIRSRRLKTGTPVFFDPSNRMVRRTS